MPFNIMTFSIMTLNKMSFRIMTFSIVTFSMMALSIMALSMISFSITINKMQHSAYWQCCYAEWRLSFIPSLANKPFMLIVLMLNVVLLSFVAPRKRLGDGF